MPAPVIDYRGALTEDDFVELVRLTRIALPSPAGSGDARLVFALGFAALGVWDLGGGGGVSAARWWFALAIPLFVWWWVTRLDPRKEWRKSPALRTEFVGRLTSEALETGPGSESRIPWPLFSAHATSPSMSILVVGKTSIPLARSFFAGPDQWESTCALIRQKVPDVQPPRRSRIVMLGIWLFVLAIVFLAWHFAQVRERERAGTPVQDERE